MTSGIKAHVASAVCNCCFHKSSLENDYREKLSVSILAVAIQMMNLHSKVSVTCLFSTPCTQASSLSTGP